MILLLKDRYDMIGGKVQMPINYVFNLRTVTEAEMTYFAIY